MSGSALLKLSQWCEHRLDAHSGKVIGSSPLILSPACASQHDLFLPIVFRCKDNMYRDFAEMLGPREKYDAKLSGSR